MENVRLGTKPAEPGTQQSEVGKQTVELGKQLTEPGTQTRPKTLLPQKMSRILINFKPPNLHR